MREVGVIDIDRVRATFAEVFDGARPEVLVRSPGRVNLIGEHTDYNDGFVLPIAMSQALYVAARKRGDRRLTAHTTAYGETVALDLDDLGEPGEPRWANYVKGVAALLLAQGVALTGAELLIQSDVPVGGGVSSSAALEVGTANALLAVAGEHVEPVPLAVLCRQAEHQYAQSPCGIMDQFICVLGRAGHALLLDCRDQRYEQIPADLAGMAWVVMDTQVKHELGQSQYPVRQQQCRQGLAQLQSLEPSVQSLREIGIGTLERYAAGMPPVVAKRCRHAVTEIARTVRAAEDLKRSDAVMFGLRMNESHVSLRDDYEVSCTELDALVEVARSVDGVYGARMTGGGFGGCAIALAREGVVESLIETIRRDYDANQAKPALVYTTTPSDGADWQEL